MRLGGAEGIRTPDPKTASLVLSQLSYSPTASATLPGGVGFVKNWWELAGVQGVGEARQDNL